MRHDGRKAQELRKLELQTNVFKYPEGSVVIRFGDTTVICSATIENSVPPFFERNRNRMGDSRI
ncbi:Ribonuclease PH/Ham1 protein [Enterococcus faecium]|nr:Ribonuclease PH/Ham1 protein [Enterococcus faecium]SMM66756.1 Ribonuclease PH/Ham1 protein [Enterococcus faecium]